jgi:hypothetical protein
MTIKNQDFFELGSSFGDGMTELVYLFHLAYLGLDFHCQCRPGGDLSMEQRWWMFASF